MPIKNYEELTPDLEPLEDVKIKLDGLKMLQLKSNANEEEVQLFVRYLAERIYAYQVLRYLDFFPQHAKKVFTENVELKTDHINEINKEAGLPEKEDFLQFTASIKDTIKNDYSAQNNGDASISVEWLLSCCFIDLTELKKVLLFNQEDLPFKEKDACYMGRSVMAVLMQNFRDQHKDIALRNFNIFSPADDPVLAKAAIEHLSKQRDITLNREETIAHLESLKCLKTGKTGVEILRPDFTVLK